MIYPHSGYSEIQGECVAFCDEPSAEGAGQASQTAPGIAKSAEDEQLANARRRAAITVAQQQAQPVVANKVKNTALSLPIKSVTPEQAKTKLKSLELKSPISDFTKGNRFSAPVQLKSSQSDLPTIQPIKIQGTKDRKGLKFKNVPLPPDVVSFYESISAFGADPFKGLKNRADLILDALEAGQGDLDVSLRFLQDKVASQGKNVEGLDALSYIEGLWLGANAVDAPVFKRDEIEYNLLADLVADHKVQWPGPTVPEEKFPNPLHWRAKRAEALLEGLKQGSGDKQKTLLYLREQMEKPDASADDAENAYHYLVGLEAYPDFVNTAKEE